MAKMGNDWARVSAGYPENDVRLANPDWSHGDNTIQRTHHRPLQTLRNSHKRMCKISSCKQKEDESVHSYLTRLTEVHNIHSGLTPPANPNDNDVTCITWDLPGTQAS